MRYPLPILWFLLGLLLPVKASALDATSQSLNKSVAPAMAFDYDSALKTSQQALDNQIREVEFIAASGERIKFCDFGGKPLVLSMIYTSCYQVCPM
ncbi:MAG: SCO family protein, partial [Gammaproteobacteria bacterium]